MWREAEAPGLLQESSCSNLTWGRRCLVGQGGNGGGREEGLPLCEKRIREQKRREERDHEGFGRQRWSTHVSEQQLRGVGAEERGRLKAAQEVELDIDPGGHDQEDDDHHVLVEEHPRQPMAHVAESASVDCGEE